MTDLECYQIQSRAILHLIRCGFDDSRLKILELNNALEELTKEMIN